MCLSWRSCFLACSIPRRTFWIEIISINFPSALRIVQEFKGLFLLSGVSKAEGGSRPPRTPPGKRLRRDAYGPDRTNRCPKLTSKGHTDLRSSISEAKFVKESDFDVKSRLAPPKSTEIDEKHFSDTKHFSNFNFSNFNFAKAGAPPVPSRSAVRRTAVPGPSLGKIKICQVF